jgi:hypothetical protein
MTTDTRTKIGNILDALEIAYGGRSQYDMSDVGAALYRSRRNGRLDGSDSDLAGIAASVLGDFWSWTDETLDEHLEQIMDAMCFEAAEDAEKAKTEARRQARRPAYLQPTDPDFQREMCRKIVCNMQTVISEDVVAYPRMVGVALATAIDDGDLENYPEALADHCSSVIWPNRHEEGFPATMETECLQWIEQAAAACKASM